MSDYRLDCYEASPPYSVRVPPPSGSNFVNTLEVVYLKDRHGARHVGKTLPNCVRFDIWEEEFTLVERWIKQRNGDWINIAIEVESEGVD